MHLTIKITFGGFNIDASYINAFGASKVHQNITFGGFSIDASYNYAFGASEPQLPIRHQNGSTILDFPSLVSPSGCKAHEVYATKIGSEIPQIF